MRQYDINLMVLWHNLFVYFLSFLQILFVCLFLLYGNFYGGMFDGSSMKFFNADVRIIMR